MLSPLWWGIVMYYMLCLPLSGPVDCVYWFAGAEVTLINTPLRNHTELAFHYLRQKGLKTRNMLRNSGLQCGDMSVIRIGWEEWMAYVELARVRLLPEAIVHCSQVCCLLDLTCLAFWLRLSPGGLAAFCEVLGIKCCPSRCLESPGRPNRA